jgi:hypothetical protein
MASIRLGRYEAEEDNLPPVCMVCGEPADFRKRKRFSWHPQWVYLLLLVGLLPCVIVALVLTKRMTVHVPLCGEHKNHWSWRSAVIWSSFLALFLLGVGAVVLISALEGERRGPGEAIGGWLCLGCFVLGLIWLIVVAVMQNSAIRPDHISENEITLVHVSPRFVEAIMQSDDAEEEEWRERSQQRRRRLADAERDRDIDPDWAPRPGQSDQFEEHDR